MQKIKVSELFYSIQGEGRYAGVSSVFLRTFGCNFECSGFGMEKGQKSKEREEVAKNINLYKSYKDLPLVTTGCDSYASWDVRFKHLSPMISTELLAEQIIELLPYKKWVSEHLVITGGEPLLGWQRAYPELLSYPEMQNLACMTFETNGTQKLSDNLYSFLFNWAAKREGITYSPNVITFSVSPKLSCSGETWEDAIQPDIIIQYQQLGYTYLKFVIATEEDCEEALQAMSEYRQAGFVGPVYLMGVGGVEDVFFKTNKQVAKLAMKYGLRYSDRMQVGLFRNAWGT